MEIWKASELGEFVREKIAEILVEEFYEIVFKFFTNDKTLLVKMFKPMLGLDFIYIAMIDEEVAGFMGYSDTKNLCLNTNIFVFVDAYVNTQFVQFFSI